MKNKISYLEFVIFTVCILIYCYLLFIGWNQYIYGMSYTKCIIYVLLLCLNIYLFGIVFNKEKIYKKNINLYIIIFLVLLISFTFFIGRRSITFYRHWSIGQYIPFYTISNQFKYASIQVMIKNIIGNVIVLVPLAFLLMIKDKKYNSIIYQSFIIIPLILFIEIIQSFTHTGVFDVDDIILNYLGSIIFIFIMSKTGLINLVKKIFYSDFNLNDNAKYILYFISLIFLILFIVSVFLK